LIRKKLFQKIKYIIEISIVLMIQDFALKGKISLRFSRKLSKNGVLKAIEETDFDNLIREKGEDVNNTFN